MIETMEDWIKIYQDSNRGKPFNIHRMQQKEFRNFKKYLAQWYVGPSRKADTGEVAPLRGMQWRNYGWGPELCDGPNGPEVRLLYHPGEVWLKDNLDVHTPWIKLDLRKGQDKDNLYKRVHDKDGVRGVETSELKELTTAPLPIQHKEFDLYTSLLPISSAKYKDLCDLSVHMSDAAKEYYTNLPHSELVQDDDDGGARVCDDDLVTLVACDDKV
jgi:hypothetical protein